MKKIFLLIGILLFNITALLADVKLPAKCEAFRPGLLYQSAVLKEVDANKIAKSSKYGQDTPPNNGDYKYWIVYSDRRNNPTYVGPSKDSGKHKELEFNEKLRIAKIQKGFALVYREPREGVLYPAISSEAESMGWVPMDKLLLWPTCPANDKGIYHKALLVLNLDKTQRESQSLGRMYKNPDDMNRYESIKTGMSFYFIMKRDANGLVLLAREYTLEGSSDKLLYGWVDENSYVSWNQRSCIEPNWDDESVTKFLQQGENAQIFADEKLKQYVTKYTYGRKYTYAGGKEGLRLPPTVLRYPILDNDTDRDDIYKCTTFGTVAGDLGQHITNINTAREEQEKALNKMRQLNLIIVIDGTKSMDKYFPAVKEAIKKGCEFFDKNKYTPRIGLVIYRDYADGEAGLFEYVKMSDPNDPMLNGYLDNGGNYGIKSASADRTHEEALFKGLEVALDTERMGYNKDESNLMLVIGDCGNADTDTKCLTQEQLVEKFVENRINLMTFQVRQNNEQAWISFNRQMRGIMKENLDQQYKVLGDGIKTTFMKCTDGFDLKPAFDFKRQFFIGSIRRPAPGVDMDPMELAQLMEKNFGDFGSAVQDRIDALANGGFSDSDLSDSQKNDGAKMDSAYMVSILGEKNYKLLLETKSLIAFSGYTKKVAPNGAEYWHPVLFISRDEFTQLMERLAEVNRKAKTDDRKPYVDAMYALVRSMLPDITNEEMEQKSTGDVMALIAGLNERSAALSGPRLIDVQDPKVVSQVEYRNLVQDFQQKYRNLRSIKENANYEYIYRFNGIEYYWIPIEDLP